MTHSVVGIFISLIALLPSLTYSHARELIAVIKAREAEPYDLALHALRRTLKEKGINARIEELLLSEDSRDERIAELRKKNPQLVVTLGSAATERVAKLIKDTPVLFCMALNPAASGFVRSMSASGNNVTGASLDIPPQAQFEALRSVVPGLKRIGVIYNPQETESVVQQARKAAKDMGLELFAVPIASADKVPEALRSLDKNVDALWSVADSTTFTSSSAEFIFLHTLRNKLPFMGLSPAFVKQGALLALAINYQEIGAQCGGLATRLLSGESPSSLPVTTPQKVVLHVNLKTAEAIGLKISPERLVGAVVLK
ncbi:MAG TPA: ABC transporter substrate-binding protein [Candidatus Binatia bacterium]|nr:ABC transporter substrate-binding protein [Candidatus Binatia bacterium]